MRLPIQTMHRNGKTFVSLNGKLVELDSNIPMRRNVGRNIVRSQAGCPGGVCAVKRRR